MVECFILKCRFYYSGVVRPTDQIIAIAKGVSYSQFPAGGGPTPCTATCVLPSVDRSKRKAWAGTFTVVSVGKARKGSGSESASLNNFRSQ